MRISFEADTTAEVLAMICAFKCAKIEKPVECSTDEQKSDPESCDDREPVKIAPAANQTCKHDDKCPQCGKDFKKISALQKFCSPECRTKHSNANWKKYYNPKPKQMKDQSKPAQVEQQQHPEGSLEAKLAKIRATCPAPKPKPEFQRELQ